MGAPKGNQFWKLRAKHGRDKIFESPDILWDSCVEYFEMTDKRNWSEQHWVGKEGREVNKVTSVPYTLSGLYVFLDIDRKTWDLYREREDFIPIVTRVEQIMFTQKLEGAAVGAFNPSIIARELGLADKKEIKTDQPTSLEVEIVKSKKKGE